MLLETLQNFADQNQPLLNYENVIAKTQKKLSFSIFRFLRNDILEKMNETNFVFAFEFDIACYVSSELKDYLSTMNIKSIHGRVMHP